MDFNPLDLLAAAALSDKGSTSECNKSDNGAGKTVQGENSESQEDADDISDNMGKTKSNSLKRPVGVDDLKIEGEMSPQKLSWSPESFLSCLDKPSLEHEKLIIESLSPTFMKDIVKYSKEFDKDAEKEVNVTKDAEEEKEVTVSKDLDTKHGLNNEISCDSVENEDPAFVHNDSPLSTTIYEKSGGEFMEKDKPSIVVKEEHATPNKDEPENPESIPSEDVKIEESSENGQSDTDTAETSDSKVLADDLPEMTCHELVSLDHPYCLMPGQLPSVDMLEDIDVCSDSSPLTEDSEQRSRNFILDCNYLKSGILEGKSIGTPQLHHDTNQSHFNYKINSPHKSPVNTDPNTLRLSKTADSSAFKQVSVLSPERPGPSYGKFKIGTFASFSSSNLELEKYLRGLDPPPTKRLETDHDRSKVFHSPIYSPSVQPLLQSPTLDWDRSEAGSETQDDSSDARTPLRLSPDFTTERVSEWTHPMFHDHDYCAKAQQKPSPDDVVKLPLAKRKYTKRKNKLDPINHEKIMKAKYLKKELLKDSIPRSTPSPLPETSLPTATDPGKTNPVGRPRKRTLEKPIEEEIDPETGAKMKITGKFQDQYVYYLSKSRSTSRRRQTPTLPLFSDKIVVPAPKPGDIFVPHLTDADIEVVRTKGRGALNIPERPHIHSASILPVAPTKSSVPSSLPISQNSSNELISDVDSHIVSTILSMESDNLASPSSSQSQDLSQTSDIYSDQPSITNDTDISTEEQVLNYLLSVVKEEEPSLLQQSSSSFFPSLPSDPLYTKPSHLSDQNYNKMEGVHSDILSSQSALENHAFGNSVIKSEAEEGNSLPDDLSSLISHSQVTTASNTSKEFVDSQSSMKSEYSSDLSSLGTPGTTPSDLRLTSIEKTLDYLGVKDGEIKLDQNDLNTPTTKLTPNEMSSTVIVSNDDTPWIVTVTLYFNDVPSIMVGTEPYIRLVDIHKQILPAKDTGILKKRCQLLNIPVLNCTEMHRYFLVQYGKAYNSKSTLIISKDQATELVKYYATPQPRLGRTEDAHIRRNSCGVQSPSSDRINVSSPVSSEALASGPVKKRGCNSNNSKSIRKGPLIPGITSPEIGVTADVVKTVGVLESEQTPTDGLNKRTRHKKVNYLEMLRGEEKEKEKPSEDSILQTIESVLKSSTDHTTTVHNHKSSKEKYSVNNKSRSKNNKLDKGQRGSEKKNKEKTNHRRKSVETKKKGKVNAKLLKSSKIKGSTSKLVKKHEKLMRKKVDLCTDTMDTDCGEEPFKSNKFKPLKLKVNSLLNFTSQRRQSSTSPSPSSSSFPSKKGLFSRSNSTSSALVEQQQQLARPMRVLAVAHQAALSNKDGDSHLPSQPADIHLDLFTKSSSACVCCHTCSQFLSVPHFMRHHHVPMDNEWLATEAAHRILVPRNKENISEEERRLWEEFHKLQEAIGGFGEADDDSESDGDENSDNDSDFETNIEPNSLETSGASSYLSMTDTSSHGHAIDISYESQITTQPSSSSSPSLSSRVSRTGSSGDNNQTSHHRHNISSSISHITISHSNINNISTCISSNTTSDVKGSELLTKLQQQQLNSSTPLPPTAPANNNSINTTALNNHTHDSTSHLSNSNVRTSSRRRKSKQLFSIENYCTTTPSKKGAEDVDTSVVQQQSVS